MLTPLSRAAESVSQRLFSTPLVTTVASSLVLLVVLYSLGTFSKKSRYPPGPKAHPLVGHTFQVPKLKTWLYFEQLGKKYGPIVRLSLAGDEIIILNDARDAKELLDRRSHNYSSRKPLIYAGKHQSKNKRLILLQYGEEFKKQRAAFHHMLQPRAIGSYESMQELESTKMLVDVLDRPDEMELNIQRYAASLVFTLSYGKRLGDDDKDLLAVIDIVEGFIRDCYPGAHLVDTFPLLDLIPGPFAPWRRSALQKHEKEMKLYNRLALEVRERIEKDMEQSAECFTSRLWENNDVHKLDLESLSYLAAATFEAGMETTASTMMWFLLAMIMYPQTLKKAQEEIDNLLGSDGSIVPTFAHMDDLPYCVALAKEVFRWMPVTPGGFPHYSDAEDEYKGYKIKAKTMVIPNIWTMHHDEADFPEPLEFKPERFLSDVTSTTSSKAAFLTEGHYGFGFGRRTCPGKYLAATTIWIGVTKLIWAFEIKHALDSEGRPIPVSPANCTSGVTSKPEPFAITILPRSSKHAETIRREWNIVSC